MKRQLLGISILVLLLHSTSYANTISPPTESDWNLVGLDPLLNIFELTRRPTIDGTIDPLEWKHATSFKVFDQNGNQWGTMLVGVWEGVIYSGTDWTINNDSDPANGGNAWRLGTSNARGPENQGNSTWFEIYVQEAGTLDIVMAKSAENEAGLQGKPFEPGADFGIDAAAGFNGNWQYEVALGPATAIGTPKPPPTKLAPSYQYEWIALDRLDGHGKWGRVYNGALHCPPRELPGGGVDEDNCAIGVPLPSTLVLFGLGFFTLFSSSLVSSIRKNKQP